MQVIPAFVKCLPDCYRPCLFSKPPFPDWICLPVADSACSGLFYLARLPVTLPASTSDYEVNAFLFNWFKFQDLGESCLIDTNEILLPSEGQQLSQGLINGRILINAQRRSAIFLQLPVHAEGSMTERCYTEEVGCWCHCKAFHEGLEAHRAEGNANTSTCLGLQVRWTVAMDCTACNIMWFRVRLTYCIYHL